MIAWLMGALGKRDWVAVVIELLTVMFGLFLGLQLDAWNDGRKAQAREHDALIRLEQEAEQSVAYFQMLIGVFNEATRDQKAAILALQSGDKARLKSTQIAEAIASLGHYPAVAPPRAIYDELFHAGLLSDIRSSEVRTAIARYYARLTFVDSQLAYFRQTQAIDFPIELRDVTEVYDPGAGGIEAQFISSADFDAIAGDKRVMRAIVSGLRDQLAFQFYRRKALEEAVAMCWTLARALNRTCNASPPLAPVKP